MGKPVKICPFCSEDQVAESYHLDVLLSPDSDRHSVEWTACCESVWELVALQGWASVWGEPMADTLRRELGLDVVKVTEDYHVILRGDQVSAPS